MKRIKKSVSLFLAVMMILSSISYLILSSGAASTTTANISFDSTGIQWAKEVTHGEYTVGQSGEELFRIFADNKDAYCIEPGHPLYSGNTLESDASDAWRNLSSAQKKAVNLALLYGKSGNSAGLSGNDNQKWVATQLVVWEIVAGCRDASTFKVTNNKFIDGMCSGTANIAVKANYNIISNKLLNHNTIPSFTYESAAVAKNHIYTMPHSNDVFTVTLSDSNQVLSDYAFKTTGGVTASISGNKITLTSSNRVDNAVTFSATKKIPTTSSTLVAYGSGSRQDVVVGVENATSKTAYFAVKTNVCGLKIVKKSSDTSLTNGNSNYSMEGIKYVVSKSKTDFDTNGSNYLGAIELNDNGVGYSKDSTRKTLQFISPGTYYVKEYSVPATSGYTLSSTVYTVTLTNSNTVSSPYALNVSDAPKSTYFKILKKSSDTSLTNGNSNYNMVGIKYVVSKSKTDFDTTGSNYIGAIDLDKNGVGYSKDGSRTTLSNLPPGTYYVKEYSVPATSGYTLSSTVYTVKTTFSDTISSPVTVNVTDAPKSTYFKIVKSSSNTSLTNGNSNYNMAGIKYVVSKSKTDFDTDGNNYIGAIDLDKNGVGYSKDGSRTTLSNLPPGTYYVKEYSVPATSGYTLNSTVYTVKTTFSHTINNPVTVSVTDAPKSTYFKIVKQSSDPSLTNGNSNYSMEGIRYVVSKSNNDFDTNGSNYIGAIDLDKNGVGYSKNGTRTTLSTLAPGTYYIKEYSVPSGSGYILNPTVYTVKTTFNNTVTNPVEISVTDEPTPTVVVIKKESTDPSLTDGNSNYSMEGIRYLVSKSKTDFETNGSNYLGFITLDANGDGSSLNGSRAALRKLPIGTYYMKEFFTSDVASSCGYKLDPTVYTVKTTASNTADNPKVIKLKDTPNGVLDARIIKCSADPDLTENNNCYSLEGAKFNLYLKEAYAQANINPVLTDITTDENGVAYISEIAPGKYFVKEIQPPKGFELSETIQTLEVEPDADNTAEISVVDIPLSDPVEVLLQKRNATTGETDSADMSGAQYEFKFYNGYYTSEEGLEGVEPDCTWIFKTGEGNEVKYDKQHLVSGDELFEDGNFPLGTVTVKEISPPTGDIPFYLDDTLYIIPIYAGEDNVVHSYNVPVSDEYEIPLTDIEVYKIWDDENDSDGKRPTQLRFVLYDQNDTIIDSVIVDQSTNYSTVFRNLPTESADHLPITYHVKEEFIDVNTTSYYQSVQSIPLTLISEGNVAQHFNSVYKTEFTNSYTPEKVRFSGKKVWNDFDNTFHTRPSAITLTLYQDNTPVESAELNSQNEWMYSFGEYNKYHDGGIAYQYEVREEHINNYESASNVSINDDLIITDFENTLIKGNVKLLKVDEYNHPFRDGSSVKFALFDSNDRPISIISDGENDTSYVCNGFNDNNELYIGEDGTVTIKDLPIGDYYFIETQTKEGYMPYDQKIEFTISSTNTEITTTVKNNRIIMPETGGIGNTVIYIIAIIIACFAAVFVVIFFVKKTSQNKNEKEKEK